eukprot:5700532-Pyramimonas_sp.AAC.1
MKPPKEPLWGGSEPELPRAPRDRAARPPRQARGGDLRPRGRRAAENRAGAAIKTQPAARGQ